MERLQRGGVWLHLVGWERRHVSVWATLLFALAALARPEYLLLFPLALADQSRRRSYQISHQTIVHIVLYCCVLEPWVIFNLWVGGKPLPNTYYAKVGDYGMIGAVTNLDFTQLIKTVCYYPVVQCQELIRLAAENNLLLACAAPLGLATMLGARRKHGVEAMSLLVPLVLILFPLIRGIVAPFKGPLFQHGRYVAHLVPLLVVVGAIGLRRALDLAPRLQQAPKTLFLHRSIVVWSLVFVLFAIGVSQYGRLYGRNVAEIEDMHIDMARWVEANTPSESIIASHDVGALGYFSGRKIVDMVGLVTPTVLEYLSPGLPADDGVLEYLRDVEPDFVIMMPTWYPGLSKMSRVFRPEHEEVVKGVRTIAAGDRLVAYRAIWDRKN